MLNDDDKTEQDPIPETEDTKSSEVKVEAPEIDENSKKEKNEVPPPPSHESHTFRLSDLKKREIRTTFVMPEWFDNAVKILTDKRLVVLYGPEGAGKREAAISLSMRQNDDQVWFFNKRVVWDDLDEFRYEPNRCYIWTGSDTGYENNNLSRMIADILVSLANSNARLVIALANFEPGTDDFLCTYSEKVTPFSKALIVQLVGQQLARDSRGLSQEQQAQMVNEIRKMDENTFRDWWPKEALRLARLLSEDHKETTAELIHRIHDSHLKQVTDWFAVPGRTPFDRAGLLALTAFEGIPYHRVNEIVTSLEQCLAQKVVLRKSLVKRTNIFRYRRSEQLRTWQVRIEPEKRATDYGELNFDTVKFNDSWFGKTVADFLWTELDHVQRPYIEWLRGYLVSADAELREFAIEACVKLADKNYIRFLSEILEPFIMSSDLRAHSTATDILLQIASLEITCRQLAISTAQHWMSRRRVAARWAGATIIAIVSQSKEDYQVGFEKLRELLEGRYDLYGTSAAEILFRWTLQDKVFRTYYLAVWHGKLSRCIDDLTEHGDIVFVTSAEPALGVSLFAYLGLMPTSEVDDTGKTYYWPDLFLPLRHPASQGKLGQTNALGEQISHLVERAFETPTSRDAMQYTLEWWIKCIDDAPQGAIRNEIGLIAWDVIKPLVFAWNGTRPIEYRQKSGDRIRHYMKILAKQSRGAQKVLVLIEKYEQQVARR